MTSELNDASELNSVAGIPVGEEVKEVSVVSGDLKQLIKQLREKARAMNPLDLIEFVPYLATPEVLADKIAQKFQIDLGPIKDYIAQFPEKFSNLSVASIASLIEDMEAMSE